MARAGLITINELTCLQVQLESLELLLICHLSWQLIQSSGKHKVSREHWILWRNQAERPTLPEPEILPHTDLRGSNLKHKVIRERTYPQRPFLKIRETKELGTRQSQGRRGGWWGQLASPSVKPPLKERVRPSTTKTPIVSILCTQGRAPNLHWGLGKGGESISWLHLASAIGPVTYRVMALSQTWKEGSTPQRPKDSLEI